MEGNWNKYKKGRVQHRVPEARIKKNGSIFLNRVATEKWFPEAEKIILFYDVDGHRIGLQKAEGNEPYARRVRMVSQKARDGSIQTRLGARIAAKPFIEEFEIPLERVCKMYFEDESGLVVIDLKGGKPCHHNRRAALSKKSSRQ